MRFYTSQRDRPTPVNSEGPASLLRALIVTAAIVALMLGALAVHRVRPVAVTLGPATVVLRQEDYDRNRMRMAVHEAMHREQYRRNGTLGFVIRYTLDRRQRLAWEAEATAAELCWARVHRGHGLDRLAESRLEGLRRYWVTTPVPDAEARAALDQAYRDGHACPRLAARLTGTAAWPRFDGAGAAAAP